VGGCGVCMKVGSQTIVVVSFSKLVLTVCEVKSKAAIGGGSVTADCSAMASRMFSGSWHTGSGDSRPATRRMDDQIVARGGRFFL